MTVEFSDEDDFQTSTRICAGTIVSMGANERVSAEPDDDLSCSNNKGMLDTGKSVAPFLHTSATPSQSRVKIHLYNLGVRIWANVIDSVSQLNDAPIHPRTSSMDLKMGDKVKVNISLFPNSGSLHKKIRCSVDGEVDVDEVVDVVVD